MLVVAVLVDYYKELTYLSQLAQHILLLSEQAERQLGLLLPRELLVATALTRCSALSQQLAVVVAAVALAQLLVVAAVVAVAPAEAVVVAVTVVREIPQPLHRVKAIMVALGMVPVRQVVAVVLVAPELLEQVAIKHLASVVLA
jgi:hypothetical protein